MRKNRSVNFPFKRRARPHFRIDAQRFRNRKQVGLNPRRQQPAYMHRCPDGASADEPDRSAKAFKRGGNIIAPFPPASIWPTENRLSRPPEKRRKAFSSMQGFKETTVIMLHYPCAKAGYSLNIS
jgi:hypothetical protein